MSKDTPSPPTPINPQTIIDAQTRANRVNRITPFGSQTYGTGPDGQTTFTTSLSPQMQGLVDRGFGLAGQDLKPLTPAPGLENLQNTLINKVASNYAHSQKPQMQPLPQINEIAGQPVNPAWNSVLQNIQGLVGGITNHG